MNGHVSYFLRRSAILLVVVALTNDGSAQTLTPTALSPAVLVVDKDVAAEKPSMVDAAPCDPDWQVDSYCCDPCITWTVHAGAVILHRSRPSGDPLYQDAIDPLFGSDFDLGWQGGYELELRRHNVTERGSISARLFVVDGWSASAGALIPGATQINTNPPLGMNGPRDITSNLNSELLSFELNYIWQSDHPAVRWLVGFRALEIDESMGTTLVPPPGVGLDTVYHAVETQNRLYGAQIGTEFDLHTGERLVVGGVLSAGLYGNTARHQSSIWNRFAPPPIDAVDRESSTAFVGETGVTTKYALTECLALRADYRVLWASGLALATEQVAATNRNLGNGIDSGATAFYHGVFFGLDWTF